MDNFHWILSRTSESEVPTDIFFLTNHVFEHAIHHFSHQQFFTDVDGYDYGVITTWEAPDMTLRGINQAHRIRWIFVLEINEQGHDFDLEVFIIV